MIRFTKSGRRQFGTLCLVSALAMLLAGQTALEERLDGVLFIVYWLLCLLFTLFAMFAALVDAAAVRAENREKQRALIESTLRDIESRQSRPSKFPSGEPPSR